MYGDMFRRVELTPVIINFDATSAAGGVSGYEIAMMIIKQTLRGNHRRDAPYRESLL